MKKSLFLTILLFAATALAVTTVQAQKIKLIDGSLSALKDVKEMKVEYEYSDMSVGKYEHEADYIKKKTADYNEKEAGKGDKWAKAWIADRKERFEPQFELLFNKYAPFKISQDAQSAYTMIVKTTATEPGFNVGIVRQNAYIDAEVSIVESANPEHIIVQYSIKRSPGRDVGGFDFDTGLRIEQAYAKAGKSLGKKMR